MNIVNCRLMGLSSWPQLLPLDVKSVMKYIGQVVRPIVCSIMYMLLSKFLVLIGRLARTGVIALQQAIYRTLGVISISINIMLYMQHYTDSTVRDNACHHATRLAHTSAADVDTLRLY